MLRSLARLAGLILALVLAVTGQRLLPPAPPGPRGNVVPRTEKRASVLALPESLVRPPPPQPDPLLAAHDVNVGTFYYNRGDYAGALARFDDAIYNDPALAEAYCRAGDTEWKLQRDPAARSEWRRCLMAAHGSQWAARAHRQLAKHAGRN
ncbi:MAG: hypothetical protein ACRD1C_06225 [Terriglobales bacterium]